MTEQIKIQGLTLDWWEACYRPGMPEFAGGTWAYTVEAADTVRLVFGNAGPYKSENQRTPVFTHAVTIPAEVAVDLAEALLKHFAANRHSQPRTSGEL
ncbi:hypothetical protein Q8A64_15005 [Oxalobacteraceae bacterium R-40]|uniref:Uncharacterized protein n=1 Tax=Keguizhuia sedimenti TaxID=3064264 RepID=A0ABU1BTJ3_9BURK|nr:hypothetical protein [Oxalobacteraceae bacterium R-40]